MQPRNHGSRCPTNGIESARYTRGSTEDGPGVSINRTGGFSSPMCWVITLALLVLATRSRWMSERPAGLCFGDFPASAGRSIFAQSPNPRNRQIGRGRLTQMIQRLRLGKHATVEKWVRAMLLSEIRHQIDLFLRPSTLTYDTL